jgi:hypothetical protein
MLSPMMTLNKFCVSPHFMAARPAQIARGVR